jgi:hypothetical protein
MRCYPTRTRGAANGKSSPPNREPYLPSSRAPSLARRRQIWQAQSRETSNIPIHGRHGNFAAVSPPHRPENPGTGTGLVRAAAVVLASALASALGWPSLHSHPRALCFMLMNFTSPEFTTPTFSALHIVPNPSSRVARALGATSCDIRALTRPTLQVPLLSFAGSSWVPGAHRPSSLIVAFAGKPVEANLHRSLQRRPWRLPA